MMIRIASAVLVTFLVGCAGFLYGVIGAVAALPIAMLISFATESLIGTLQQPGARFASLWRRA